MKKKLLIRFIKFREFIQKTKLSFDISFSLCMIFQAQDETILSPSFSPITPKEACKRRLFDDDSDLERTPKKPIPRKLDYDESLEPESKKVKFLSPVTPDFCKSQ